MVSDQEILEKRAVRFGLKIDEEVLKRRADRFKDQLGNNENLHLDEKKKRSRKGKLNKALGNKKVLMNKFKFSDRRKSFRNRRFEKTTKTRGFANAAFKGRGGQMRRLRGNDRNNRITNSN